MNAPYCLPQKVERGLPQGAKRLASALRITPFVRK
jgi:hypothetical protein